MSEFKRIFISGPTDVELVAQAVKKRLEAKRLREIFLDLKTKISMGVFFPQVG